MKLKILLFIFIPFLIHGQTKSSSQLDDWSEQAQNSVGESSVFDVSGAFGASIHIQHALGSDGTAHTGGVFYIQGRSNSSGDEDWHTIVPYPMITGTPNIEAFTATEPASETVIAVASTTGLYDDDGMRWIFVEDNTTASSEICLAVSHSANTSVTILDGLTNEHTTADNLFDIADSRTIIINLIENPVDDLRVVVDNTVDSDGSSVYWRIRTSTLDAL